MKQDEGEIDQAGDLDALMARIDALPDAERVQVGQRLAAGMSPKAALAHLTNVAESQPPMVRKNMARFFHDALPERELVEVLTDAEYSLPPLAVAYDRATKRERLALDKIRQPIKPLKEPSRSKFHRDTMVAPAVDAGRAIEELRAALLDRDERVSRGERYTEAQEDAFSHAMSSRLVQILGALGRSTSPTPTRRQSLKVKWHSETETGRDLWRKCSDIGQSPEVVAFNAKADAMPELPPKPREYRCALADLAR